MMTSTPHAPQRVRTWRLPMWSGVTSLLDQALVSGTNFVTTVVIGRICGEHELGLYTLGFTVLVMLLGAQDSLISLPYTVFSHNAAGKDREQLLLFSFIHYGSFAVLTSASLGAVALGARYAAMANEMAELLGILAACAAMTMLRDFVRRVAFAQMKMGKALGLDTAASALQILGLLAVAYSGRLSGTAGLLVGGIACGTSAAALIAMERPCSTWSLSGYTHSLARHWRYGSWIMLAQILCVANGYIIHWLLALLSGAADAGVFAACMTLVFFTNPLVIGVGNYLTPALARLGASSDIAGIRRLACGATGLLGGSLLTVLLLVWLWAEPLMGALFGPSFVGYGTEATWVTFCILLRAVGVAPEQGLRALQAPLATFTCQAISFAVSTTVAVQWIPRFGILGGAYALAVGYGCASILRWILFWKVLLVSEKR